MARSVPVRRLVRYVFAGFSMLYCRPCLSSCISSLLNFMLVRFVSLDRIAVVHHGRVDFFFFIVLLAEGTAFY